MNIKSYNDSRDKYLKSIQYSIPRVERHYWNILNKFFRDIHFGVTELEEYNIDKEGNVRISDGYYLYKYNKDAMIEQFGLVKLGGADDPMESNFSMRSTIYYCYKHLYQLKVEEPNHSNKLNKKIIKDLKMGESINVFIMNNGGFRRIGLVKGDITKVTNSGFFYMDTYGNKEIKFDNVIFYSNRLSICDDKYIDGDEFQMTHLSPWSNDNPVHTIELCSVIKEKSESLMYSI